MRTREREWNNPNTSRSHNTTPMTTTAFKIDLMLPAMGIKRFTSHNRTPMTIRVSRMGRRGILFTFLSLLQDISTLATNCCQLCPRAENLLNHFNSTKDWAINRGRRASNVLFNDLSAHAGLKKLKWMDWPTLQSFSYQTILDSIKDARLFTCIHFAALFVLSPSQD